MPKNNMVAYALKLQARNRNEMLRQQYENRRKVYLHGVGVCTKNKDHSQK